MPIVAAPVAGVIPSRGTVAPDLRHVDHALFAEIDERCLGLDRALIQLTQIVKEALIRAAPHRDRELRNALAAALVGCDDATREAGELGVALLELRDGLFPEGAP